LTFDVVWHEKVKNDLKSLNKADTQRIIRRIQEHLVQDPTSSGKPLKGVFKGLFRYRIGSFRVIYAVDYDDRRVIVLHIKNRKDAYR